MIHIYELGLVFRNQMILFAFFLDILPDMTTGVIALKGDKLTLDRATLYKIKDRQTSDKNIKIPENYQLDDRCIWDKPEGGYWQNSCSEWKIEPIIIETGFAWRG